MKLELSSSNRIVIGVVAVVAVALGFWVLAIGPKRGEASKLEAQVERVKGSLAQHEAEIVAAEQARGDFATEYQHLVVLGKAVPGNDDTASLLVQVNQIARRAGVRFRTLELSGESGGEEEAVTTESTPAPESTASHPASATEVAASTMPLGATIGPAGLGVMPYTLDFSGNFFQVADFIHGLDSLVETQKERVAVDGRLLTIDGFSLSSGKNGFPSLEATFSVTTYLTPPGQGLTGGATSESPTGTEEAVPASATTGGVAR
jgi:Tfp pilus assembly protein PilO